MQPGQIAFYITAACTVVAALISAIVSRGATVLTRRTELDKIYMARLGTVEGDNDNLRKEVDVLREQHRVDMTALDRMKLLENEIAELKRLLKAETDRTGEA